MNGKNINTFYYLCRNGQDIAQNLQEVLVYTHNILYLLILILFNKQKQLHVKSMVKLAKLTTIIATVFLDLKHKIDCFCCTGAIVRSWVTSQSNSYE